MKKVLGIFCLATVLVACAISVGCKQKPDINHKQMANILVDMQLADAYTNVIASDSDKQIKLMRNPDSLDNYYNAIFAHHKISAGTFKTNYNWYTSRPHELDSVISLMTKISAKWIDK